MTSASNVRGMIAVDKIGCKILFLNPQTYETETVLDGFQRTVHELLVMPETGRAYVPIFGDGIHGRNPQPRPCVARHRPHQSQGRRYHRAFTLSAPHTVRLGADKLIYITCENSAKVAVIDPKTNKVIDAIDSGSTNGHRLAIAPDGQRLYTDNEEDATVSVIDVPNRKLLGKIKTPQALAGIAVSGDGRNVVAVSDEAPVIFLIDTAAGKVTREVALEGVPKAAQIARYSPDGKLVVVIKPQQQHADHRRRVIQPIRPRSRSATSLWISHSAATSCSSAARATARCMSSTSLSARTSKASRPGRAASRSDFSRRNTARHWRSRSSR